MFLRFEVWKNLPRIYRPFLVLIMVGLLCLSGQSQQTEVTRLTLSSLRVYRIAVPANIDWTDTGIDVRSGQSLHFKASGALTLQQGNPIGFCGPDGLDLATVQQPLKDHNYGALIGKIVLTLSVEIDEETGEEIRDELIEYFYIGSERTVDIPLDGSLYLGLNELVVEDNSGILSVEYELDTRRRIRLSFLPIF